MTQKRKKWDPTGADAIYIYRNIDNYSGFKEFLRDHQDWIEKYPRANLRRNYINCVERLKQFREGNRK